MPAESDTRPVGPPSRIPPAEAVVPLVPAGDVEPPPAGGDPPAVCFLRGDRVRSDGVSPPDTVLAVFATRSGAVRYVIEGDRGDLRIALPAELGPE